MMEFLPEDIEIIYSMKVFVKLEYLLVIISFMENQQWFFIMDLGIINNKINKAAVDLIWMHLWKPKLILGKSLKAI